MNTVTIDGETIVLENGFDAVRVKVVDQHYGVEDGKPYGDLLSGWVPDAMASRSIDKVPGMDGLQVKTPHGPVTAYEGDWILRAPNNTLWVSSGQPGTMRDWMTMDQPPSVNYITEKPQTEDWPAMTAPRGGIKYEQKSDLPEEPSMEDVQRAIMVLSHYGLHLLNKPDEPDHSTELFDIMHFHLDLGGATKDANYEAAVRDILSRYTVTERD